MSRGVVLIARNNKEIDYIKQAAFASKRIKKYLDLPTTLLTDNVDYVNKNQLLTCFDKVIILNNVKPYTVRKYKDGLIYQNLLDFKNTDRSDVYNLTPYDETLLLDTDLVVSDDMFLNCFTQSANLMMYSKAFELSNWRDTSEFTFITDSGPKFYWATAVFFRKSKETEIFFNLIKHVEENWAHYKKVYQIVSSIFRNDFAFSIAAHIMNGHTSGNFIKEMPGTLYYTADRDELIKLEDEDFLFLIEKENQSEHFLAKIKNKTVHVMNKYSLNRVINDC